LELELEPEQEAYHFMKIGEVIRKYRKEKNLTQEEMAQALGVTAPAVNKWENGNSLPDIMLLAPIARLLDITTDTLLCFREALTEEEIKRYVRELEERLKQESYEEAFQWARQKLQQYPNCEALYLNMAAVLHGWKLMKGGPEGETYDEEIAGCYIRALDSSDEEVRYRAANSLFSFYLSKEEYDEAEKYLSFFSFQNPEKKRQQAVLYARRGQRQEAYRAYEELLFSEYQMINMALYGIFLLAMEEGDRQKAHDIVDRQETLARLFEMGEYNENMWRLELAAAERDADSVVGIMEKLLESCRSLGKYSKAALYGHMDFQEVQDDFYMQLRENLLKCFQDEGTYGWLKGNERWEALRLTERN